MQRFILVFISFLLFLVSCKNNQPETIRFETVEWNNPGRYNLTEYGYDKEGTFSFSLEKKECTLGVTLVEKDIACYAGIIDDMTATIDAVKESYTVFGKSPVYYPTKEVKYFRKDAYVLRAEYYWGTSMMSGNLGFIDVVLFDSKLFLIIADVSDDANLNILKETVSSIHIQGNNNSEYDKEMEADSFDYSVLNKATILNLCQYIPDHYLKPEAKWHMTNDFYTILASAFDAPDSGYQSIGEGEWLSYFVTGNGGSKPFYEVNSVTQTDNSHSVVSISVKDIWQDGEQPKGDPRYYHLILTKEDGEWRIDDFDGKKKECKLWVDMMRQKYETGEIIKILRSDPDTRKYVPVFKRDLESWYATYGR